MDTSGTGEFSKRILYVSELLPWHNWTDGYNKIEKGIIHRLPQSYVHNLNFYCCGFYNIQDHIKEGDVVIVQTPCNDELNKLKIIKKYIERYPIFITQESSIYDWFDWPAEEQSIYIDLLEKCSAFLYHNEHDRKVMSAFVDKFILFSGCTNASCGKPKTREILKNPRSYVSIPSPVKRYQRGVISHKIAHDVLGGREKILAMKYNRPTEKDSINAFLSFPDAYKTEHIDHVGSWLDPAAWFSFINGSKFGIDINREFSGGNVCLEYALLATPLVGNELYDYQRRLFPLTSFEICDYDSFKEVTLKLSEDGDFYEEVSRTALENLEKNYTGRDTSKKLLTELQKFI